jgi:hypothetical protein
VTGQKKRTKRVEQRVAIECFDDRVDGAHLGTFSPDPIDASAAAGLGRSLG